MAEDQNEIDIDSVTPVQTGGGKSPLVLLLLMINSIALGVVAYFQYQYFQKSASEPDLVDIVKQELNRQSKDSELEIRPSASKEEGTLLPLEAFTVNLAQGEGPRRYLRMEAVLKFDKDSKEDEFQARQAQIRDTIIGILNSKRPEDLLRKEGKTYLKEEIKTAINSFLIDGKILDLYYVAFQIN